jgi:hypothetical protein
MADGFFLFIFLNAYLRLVDNRTANEDIQLLIFATQNIEK